MIAILGSGFGLYGYVPALAETFADEPLILEIAYQPIFSQRPELQSYLPRITWADSRAAALQKASTVIIALRPEDQWIWACRVAQYPHITHVILEKPLAPTPEQSEALFTLLSQAQKIVRVAYNFQFTDWGKQLLTQPPLRDEVDKLELHWHFKAHHFLHDLNTWKRFHIQGGGVLRFYAIHLIALLAAVGYDDVENSELIYESDLESPYQWHAIFSGPDLARCHVDVNSSSVINRFSMRSTPNNGEPTLFELSQPFEHAITYARALDYRVGVLAELCATSRDGQEELWVSQYTKVNALWSKVEQASKISCARTAHAVLLPDTRL